MVKILWVDAVLSPVTLGMSEDEASLWDFEGVDKNAILASLERQMEKSGDYYENVDAFSVTIGPGSYTLLRNVISMIRGLNLPLKKPILTPTLFDFYRAAYEREVGSHKDKVLISVDSKKGDYFCTILEDGRLGDIFIATESQIDSYENCQKIGDYGRHLKVELHDIVRANLRLMKENKGTLTPEPLYIRKTQFVKKENHASFRP